MAEKSVPTQKRLVLLSGRSHPELAESVADELGIALSPTLAYDFANGEIFIRFRSPFVGRTPSSCRATPRRSTRGSWSN